MKNLKHTIFSLMIVSSFFTNLIAMDIADQRAGTLKSLKFGIVTKRGASHKEHGQKSEDRVQEACLKRQIKQGKDTDYFFGVFDGHGSDQVAKYLEKKLALNLLTKLAREKDHKGLDDAIKSAFKSCDDEVKQLEKQGSCALIAVVLDNTLTIANTGDTVAYLITETDAGLEIGSTQIDRPTFEDECKRIKDAKGTVVENKGALRVQGIYSCSRAIGDHTRVRGLIADPRIYKYMLNPSYKLLIICSDGVWEIFNTPEQNVVFSTVMDSINKNSDAKNPAKKAAQKLIDRAIEKGARDDLSAIVVIFDWQ